MREETIKLYQFDELSDDAKEKARDWYRQASSDDSFWSETVIDDAATVLKACGFDVYQRPVKLMGGGTQFVPAIYWSGFYSQGDGACFEASWSPADIMPHEQFCAEYPATWTNQDGTLERSESNAELQRIHAESVRLAALDPTRGISWRCKNTGRYCHEHSVSFEHWDEREPLHCELTTNESECNSPCDCRCDCAACQVMLLLEDIESDHEENARDAMRWIYRQLEREYEWINSDEQVDESIRVNAYEFTADGERY